MITSAVEAAVIFAYFAGVGVVATTPVDVLRKKAPVLDQLFAVRPGIGCYWVAVLAVGWPGIPIASGLNRLANHAKRGAR